MSPTTATLPAEARVNPRVALEIRRSDALVNKARVLEAAREVFAEQGIAAEINDIARRANVGIATIYRGFGNKDGLVQAAVAQARSELAAALTEAEGTADAANGLRILLTRMLSFAETHGWLVQASLRGDDLGPAGDAEARRTEHRRRMGALIERGGRDGSFRTGTNVEVLMLLIEGLVLSWTIRARKQRSRPSAVAVAEGVLSLITGPGVEPASSTYE